MLVRPKIRSYLAENFIPILVDFDKDPGIVKEYGVRGIPVIWFLDRQGNRIRQVTGYIPEDRFLPVLQYIQTDAYNHQSFAAFTADK